MKRPNKEEYENMLGDEKFIAYTKSLEDYCEYLEKNNRELSNGLDNACEKLEALRACIDILTDKETKQDKEYWKKKVMKTLTKTRCMSLLDDIAGYAHRANIGPNGINEINEDYNELKKLIEEHFTPQPLKFEDLKEDMFVIDVAFRTIIQIKGTDKSTTRIDFIDHDMEEAITYFQNGRFYPITIPKVMEE